jgi:hypothetical protein
MNLLLPICGKFTRALLAHQIFFWKIKNKNIFFAPPLFFRNFDKVEIWMNDSESKSLNEQIDI